MNENIIKEILAEISKEEIAELNMFPPFKPSLRHRFAMRRIFALFEKKTRVAKSDPPKALTMQSRPPRLRKKLIILFAVIICAALFTGFVAIYHSKNFQGIVYPDNTRLFAVNTEGCPTTIEYEYYLPELPDGYEMVEQCSLSFIICTVYENKLSGQTLMFNQYVKNSFSPHYNTEYYTFEDVDINGHAGLCIDFSDDEHNSSIIIWDNGDYILELVGNLSKNDLAILAKSAKILRKQQKFENPGVPF